MADSAAGEDMKVDVPPEEAAVAAEEPVVLPAQDAGAEAIKEDEKPEEEATDAAADKATEAGATEAGADEEGAGEEGGSGIELEMKPEDALEEAEEQEGGDVAAAGGGGDGNGEAADADAAAAAVAETEEAAAAVAAADGGEAGGADAKAAAAVAANDPALRPEHGSEVFVGGVTQETTEEDLRELCSSVGEIFEVRIMKDKETGANKGYGFVTFMDKATAEKAITSLADAEVKGRKLRVTHSQSKHRLFVGNVPKQWGKEELEAVLAPQGTGLVNIELLMDPKFPTRNRGFAFLEYHNHACAEAARRNLSKPSFLLNGRTPTISWADPRSEPDAATMAQVRVVYVRGLPESATEEQLKELFSRHGEVEKAMIPPPKPGQPKREFGFVHFVERASALKAIEKGEKYELDGKELEASLAKPQPDRRSAGQDPGYPPQRGGRGGGPGLLPDYPPDGAYGAYGYAGGYGGPMGGGGWGGARRGGGYGGYGGVWC